MTNARSPEAVLQRRCVLAGVAVGILGFGWILHSHDWPERAWHYHVPLAVLFGTYGSWLVLGARGSRLAAHATASSVALLLIIIRIRGLSFLSGHGVLGSLLLFLAPWPWLRWSGVLILVQALVTKAARPEEQVWTVVAGAAAGFVLGFGARALETRLSVRAQRRLGTADDLGRAP